MEEMLLRMVSPSENRREGCMYHVCIMVGGSEGLA